MKRLLTLTLLSLTLTQCIPDRQLQVTRATYTITQLTPPRYVGSTWKIVWTSDDGKIQLVEYPVYITTERLGTKIIILQTR